MSNTLNQQNEMNGPPGTVTVHDAMTEEQRKELEDAGLLSNQIGFRLPLGLVGLPKGHKSGNNKDFEYAEHGYLGDAITLKLADGTTQTAKDHPFTLPNGLVLTYGQINGLAGDFYGTYDPICLGSNFEDQCGRFQRAYDTLAQKPERTPDEAREILDILQEEINQINKAIKNGQDTSPVYNSLPDVNVPLQMLTLSRPSDMPSYLKLASLNLDHFGVDARTAYNAGHYLALKAAAEGNLDTAYTINAFCDHFLEDQFAAGHLRTPRRGLLYGDLIKDLCAKYMHDEDNALGLEVKNPRGDEWTAYGDKRLADHVDKTNLSYCKEAVQASADEVYDCFKSRHVPLVDDFRVWQIAPTLESANSASQACCPLFRLGEDRRNDINVRRKWEFTTDWWFWATLALLGKSKRWDFPMQLDP